MAIIEAMAVAPDSHAVGDADIAFHERLVALADSPRLTRMHNILLIETRICIRALEVSYAEDGDVRFAEHRAIAQSFLDREPGLTDKLLVAHMKDAVQRLTVAATLPSEENDRALLHRSDRGAGPRRGLAIGEKRETHGACVIIATPR